MIEKITLGTGMVCDVCERNGDTFSIKNQFTNKNNTITLCERCQRKFRDILNENLTEKNGKKKLWEMLDGGDYAYTGGLFKATDEEIESLIGKEIYFGEIEGKHSEVVYVMEKDDFKLISDNPAVVAAVPEVGINPLHYLEV